ncbi:DNA polymerase III subunit gamma/tau [Robbsia andropogonis]|uniref:DNA polymerase III subunit gamma/tau n=2 Tax=Robbsia andropogonis TaxID=28092 RepID=UPI000463A528|nr:DNA polymerase III subunit gamma/tau [Robbsia andropogonis]
MTYQVLARKWRPRDFPSLVGQDHVVRALTHALEQQRLHHAYLFTGTRGVGKTTLSRILAKALNCETGITAQPCGVCRACVEIDAGRFVDYVEMDAASNRGVDEMAALLERAIYAPVDARFKVYMIDEVHMLTNHAFNAMLKTLEEPPAHVKFILATTDPQKIPVTVLSRCLQFNLKQMPAHDIVDHLAKVLGDEQIAFEPQALRLLARAASGSMRDALSLTDQAIAYAAGTVSDEAVRGMLGALDQHYLVRLLDGLIAHDGAAVLAVADEMAGRSLSFSTALQDLAQWLNRIGWAQSVPGSVMDEWPEAEDIRRFARTLGAEQIQLYYQIATIGRSEMGLAPDEYAGFTMTLLRMLAFRPVSGTPFGGVTASPGAAGTGGGDVHATRAAAVPPTTASVKAPIRPSMPPAPSKALVTTGGANSAPRDAVGEAVVPFPDAMKRVDEPAGDVAAVPSVAVAPAAANQADLSTRPLSFGRMAQSPDTGIDMNTVASEEAVNAFDEVATPTPAAKEPAALAGARGASTPASADVHSAGGEEAAQSAASGARAKLAALGVLKRTSSSTSSPTARRGTAAKVPTAPAGPGLSVPTSRNMDRLPATRASDATARDARDDTGMPAPWDDVQDADGAAADAFLASMGSNGVAASDARRDRAESVSDSVTTRHGERAGANGGLSSMGDGAIDVPRPPPGIAMTAIGIDSDWPAFAMTLEVKGLAQQLAHQSELIQVEADRLQLRVPVTTLASGGHLEKVRAAVQERLGRDVQLQVEVGPAQCTAAAVYAAERAALQRRAEASIRDDAFVRALIDDFGASILPGATRPLSAR